LIVSHHQYPSAVSNQTTGYYADQLVQKSVAQEAMPSDY
jgi:hypothetical protein